jgi:hypothetical protein
MNRIAQNLFSGWFQLSRWFPTERMKAIRDVIAAFGEASGRNSIDALKERFERAFRGANQVLWPRRRSCPGSWCSF